MDYEALINLLLENNKALKEEIKWRKERLDLRDRLTTCSRAEIDSVVEARDEALEKMKRYREEVVWLQEVTKESSETIQKMKCCGNCHWNVASMYYNKCGGNAVRSHNGKGKCNSWALYKP